MIIVLANVYLKEGTQKEFLVAAKKCINETIKENGNISYDLKQNAFDSTTFTFVEKWESQEVLDAHMKTAHFSALGNDIKNLVSKDLEIALYNAEEMK